MSHLLKLPQPSYQWPPHVTAPLSQRILGMIAQNLQTRAGYRSEMSLTRWPFSKITFTEYNRWRMQGDRQRLPATPREPLTPEEAARRKRERERKSPKLRAIHHKVRTALICLALTDWELLVYKNTEGIHFALDILDGVRCKVDRAGFVAENGSIPVLIPGERLTEHDRAMIDRLVDGEPPDYVNGLGHYGMGELLRTGANFWASWIYLQQPGAPDPRTPEGLGILRQPPPLALLTDLETQKLASTFGQSVLVRREEARVRQRHYERTNRQPSTSGRYA